MQIVLLSLFSLIFISCTGVKEKVTSTTVQKRTIAHTQINRRMQVLVALSRLVLRADIGERRNITGLINNLSADLITIRKGGVVKTRPIIPSNFIKNCPGPGCPSPSTVSGKNWTLKDYKTHLQLYNLGVAYH